jgi:hypothetical protein
VDAARSPGSAGFQPAPDLGDAGVGSIDIAKQAILLDNKNKIQKTFTILTPHTVLLANHEDSSHIL